VTAATRLAGFGAVVALAFGGAALAGAAIDPDRASEETRPTTAATADSGHGDAMPATADSGHADDGQAHAAEAVRGLAVAKNGLRLSVEQPELRRGATRQLRFRVVDEAGATVRDFDVEHTKRMHTIVVRRDLTGFQHVHPTQRADGTWVVPVRLDAAGSYRLFADFSRDGEAQTLASDLRVDGAADLRALPTARVTAVSDLGADVRLDAGQPHAGQPTTLRFGITRKGQPVDVEPYLGADGHLVALRDGDLAYLHVHPGGDGYEVTFPTEGRYRLFLQFQDAGEVHTVAFTQEVAR
jgi:hypothetical protein